LSSKKNFVTEKSIKDKEKDTHIMAPSTKKLMIALSMALCVSACSSNQSDSRDVTSDKSTVVSAADLQQRYVTLLCNKYEECGIKVFSNQSDCQAKIAAVLEQSPQWKDLKLKNQELDQCLDGFRGLTCEDFTTGKSPDECKSL
jgi:hypothetical protein